MVRTGIVKSKKGDTLQVCFETPEHCAGCRGCSRSFLPKSELLTVFGNAEVGDTVDVEMREQQAFRATLLAYAVPLCTLLLGLLAGYWLGLSDALTLLTALAGLAIGYFAVKLVELQLRRNAQWRPTIIAVHRPDTERNETTEQ